MSAHLFHHSRACLFLLWRVVDATTTSRLCAAVYYLCELKLPQRSRPRQVRVTHRLFSPGPLRDATRAALRFDVAAEPPRGLGGA